MPCTITDAEVEDYNKRHYGVAMTDTRLLVYLLCLACKQIEDFGLQIKSEHLKRWWEAHMLEDEQRTPGDKV